MSDPTDDTLSRAAAALGARGGAAGRGKAKRRSRAHYRAMLRAREAAREPSEAELAAREDAARHHAGNLLEAARANETQARSAAHDDHLWPLDAKKLRLRYLSLARMQRRLAKRRR